MKHKTTQKEYVEKWVRRFKEDGENPKGKELKMIKEDARRTYKHNKDQQGDDDPNGIWW